MFSGFLFRQLRRRKGFTLLELLLVISIIGILAGIVIVAINPSKQFADSRDAKRKADVNTILNAVYQYSLDNNGALPTGPTGIPPSTGPAGEICKTGGACSGLVDLTVLTTNEKYLVSIPTDPTGSSANGAGYEIIQTPGGRVTVSAPDAEITIPINVTR